MFIPAAVRSRSATAAPSAELALRPAGQIAEVAA